MKPKIMTVEFCWEKYLIAIRAVPTKNGKFQPKWKYCFKEGSSIGDPNTIKQEIPNNVLKDIFARAAVVFNKF